jgi:hypothetical protein
MSDDLVKRLREVTGGKLQYTNTPNHLRLEAADRIEELEAQRAKTYQALLKVTKIHDEVEAKLAKAEWLLVEAKVQLEEGKAKTRRNRADLIQQFLNGLKHAE